MEEYLDLTNAKTIVIAKLNSNFNFIFSLSVELSLALLSNFPTPHPNTRVSSESSIADLENILTKSRKHLI